MRGWFVALAVCASLLEVACDPANACDPGYYKDHGGCLRNPASADAGDDADGGGQMFRNDDSDFGIACDTSADCGGKAPVCGSPMLPLCTAVNCLDGSAMCPADWTCLDVSALTTMPDVSSICIRL